MGVGLDWNKIIQEEIASYDEEMQSYGLDKTDFSTWHRENVVYLGLSRRYEKMFNERFALHWQKTTKEGIEILKQCISNNIPYKWSELPEGAID